MKFRFLCWVPAVLVLLLFLGCDNSKPTVMTVDYDELTAYSEGMAAVQKEGLWGFIDLDGQLVIPPEYRQVRSFSDGAIAYREKGRWGYINSEGKPLFEQTFYDAGDFSEGLAPVKDRVDSSWKYIDKKGNNVISAQFDAAQPFKQGMAVVKKEGKYQYINKEGSIVFATEFYRAYSFSEDGLAEVRRVKNGKYGYIALDGSLKFEDEYGESSPFSDGLAAVRKDGKWGYINTSGVLVIQPQYAGAAIFAENRAAVKEGKQFYFIAKDGKKVFSRSFDWAGSFDKGRALVLNDGVYQYINAEGLEVGYATSSRGISISGRGVTNDDECKDYESIHNAYQAGFTRYSLVNVDDQVWDISTKDTATILNCNGIDKATDAIPGFPSSLGTAGASLGYHSFIVHSQEGACGAPQGLFDMTLTSNDKKTTLTLSNSIVYKAPPPPPGHSLWDFLKDGFELIKSTVELAEGDVFQGLSGYAKATYGLVNNAEGSTDNEMPADKDDGTHYLSALSGVVNGEAMNPLNGSFCGGDEYAISDGLSLVAEMTAARSEAMLGEVSLVLYRYDRFFALRAAQKLDYWRQKGGEYVQSPYSDLLGRVFANYKDSDDTEFCESKDGSQGYLNTLSSFEPFELLDFWDLANNFDTMCDQPMDAAKTQTFCEYFVSKLPQSCMN